LRAEVQTSNSLELDTTVSSIEGFCDASATDALMDNLFSYGCSVGYIEHQTEVLLCRCGSAIRTWSSARRRSLSS
jgi:hypothetical protein